MKFVDTHTHLYDAEAYPEDMDAAVRRAIDAGVTRMILPDINSESRESMFRLAERFPGNLFPCIGLHPTDVKPDTWEKELEAISSYKGAKVWAIGETGMDLYWSRNEVEEQKEVFRRQLKMAVEMNLPVIIHSRDATEPILSVLSEFRKYGLRGVMHAYSGSPETFRELQKLGDWYVGIGGVITFKKASIARTICSIPMDRILLETDSPYLTPVPHRGERNESAYIPFIAEKVAQQKGISLEEIAAITTENAEKLFGI